MSRMTPPMGISGAFLLRAPFVADTDKSYTVIAIRQFNELIARGQDPLKLVYEPVGLTETAYRADVAEYALVICLRDKDGSLLYVPDTYIERYPNMGSVKYSHLVLAVSMGMWPEDRSVDDIVQAVTESVKAKIGVDPVFYVTRAPVSDYVSEQQHTQLIAARRAAVTNTETTTATIIRLSDEVARLQRIIDEQVDLIAALVNTQQSAPEGTP